MEKKNPHRDSMDSLRRLRLKLQDEQLLLVPQIDGGQVTTMTRMSLSQLDWIQRVALAFWQRHRRCMAVLLLLDVETRDWTLCVPTQAATADGARWRLDDHRLPEMTESQALGGTFQMRLAVDLSDLMSSVPPVDGLHFVLRMQANEARLYAFIVAEEQCRPVDINLVVTDDWQEIVDSLADRIAIEN